MKDLKHLQTFENFRVDEEFIFKGKKTEKEDLKEESEFLKTDKGIKVKKFYKKGYKGKAVTMSTRYAKEELGKTGGGASDFTKNVFRILDDRVSELDEPMKGGRGASSGAA